MTSDAELASRLLPEQPGWATGPASLCRSDAGDLLCRTYHKGRTRASVEVTAGKAAAAMVAQTMNFPLQEGAAGMADARVWMLEGRKAHLVQTAGGGVHSLGIILRGGPGDLPGSVRLQIGGSYLRPDDAIGLALALPWGTITRVLAGEHLLDPARMAEAANPPAVAAGNVEVPILWPMLPLLQSMEQVSRLERRRPPRFAVANMDVIAGMAATGGDALEFAAMPTPVLVIGQRGFAPDYIWTGLHFASARLRHALGLGLDAIEYRDVDTGASAAAARAADYKVFRVVQQADPVDLARMYGHEPDRGPDGNPTTAWLLSITGPHAVPRRTVWRKGFVPPAPLFRDRIGRLMATEALADRVARAGLTDVAFQDVTSEAALHGPSFRDWRALAMAREPL